MNNVIFKLFSIVFLCFFSYGASIAIMPIYIKTELYYSSLIVGFVIGLQYISTLFSRFFSGMIADQIGAKTCISWGLYTSIFSGIMYFICSYLDNELLQLFFLILGRISLGVAESLIVTGSLSWALTQLGKQHAGKVMAWNGNAMYGGVALGAVAGSYLYQQGCFKYIAYASIFLPLITLFLSYKLQNQIISSEKRLPFYKVMKFILLPGVGLFLSTAGYGVILSFLGLFFHANAWGGAQVGIMLFGFAYVLARFLFSSFPDRFGGARVAFVSFIIEGLGQSLIFFSSSSEMALLGSFLSGFGFSLVVPSLGVEAVKCIPIQSRGSAMGAFLAFFDLSFCILIPLSGAIAKVMDYYTVFLMGTVCCFMGLLIACKLLKQKSQFF